MNINGNNRMKRSLLINSCLLGLIVSTSVNAEIAGPGWYQKSLSPLTPENAQVYIDGSASEKQAALYQEIPIAMKQVQRNRAKALRHCNPPTS